ncbi:hypothetical protein FisN_10Hh093 [Fistulifera solaris]|uniref:EamA domain-containing protein n=1 Tax=Fistulifera solaris TaxID=1519565 RepID=A0A1Z5JXC0_FISSO|nr:hypothetical protein FisN_10Hh093 [Fistulifera solaris]|eukprot:GAX18693.1 hypothetical protein FisN_10Hh093 [Fistulifera solaris]
MLCEICGWAAAIASALAFGSFGVLIKSDAAKSVDIDPLVFQSYKTFMCFLTSWIVLFYEDFHFSPWGIVSGLFWVPGGIATVYAIKSAGLAIGIGIGSSIIVLVSFIWGIFVFGEEVRSLWGACFAVLCMMGGLMGMSYFSSPDAVAPFHDDITLENLGATVPSSLVNSTAVHSIRNRGPHYHGIDTHDDDECDHFRDRTTKVATDDELGATKINSDVQSTQRTETNSSLESLSDDDNADLSSDTIYILDGIPLTRRHRGMLAAVFCGAWGGSVMAPMKLCKSDTQGVGYLLSFSIGASIVTISLWIMRYIFYAWQHQSLSSAYQSLPPLHLRVMWCAGGTSGLLWSIGNFFSLISVKNLGQGVGYPLSQTSILVSGLWGIFYFREVTGWERISRWLLSSLLTIFGILLLSYEHHASDDV